MLASGGQAEQAGLSHIAQEKSRERLDKGACNILSGGINQGKGRERDHTRWLEASHDGMGGSVSSWEGMSFSKVH